MALYTDFKLTQDGDRAIENGSFVIIEDSEVIKQSIETNVRLSKKDWFLNFNEGVRYFTDEEENGLLGAKILTSEQEGQIQAAIENTQGVVLINNIDFDLGQERLTINVEVLTIFGQENLTIEV